ncbi:hypothetical protein [Pseudoalteromonas aliena]|jgi:hypothetical protein|uniref:hypothetical protein n=1 Tax=Pseudoalteromonas aliena TaxID=247523 RepID=UPI0024942606|nr:hypothetical protein [Pseudoalteromonas aliena]
MDSPKVLDIESKSHRDESIQFFTSIYSFENSSDLVSIDFSPLEVISDEAFTLLFSLMSLIKCDQGRVINFIRPKNDLIKKLFIDNGFWVFTGREIGSSGVHKFKKMLTGVASKESSLDLIDYILKYSKLSQLPYRLRGAIQEAIYNIQTHAYKNNHLITNHSDLDFLHSKYNTDFKRGRWWCFFDIKIQGPTNELILVISDIGIGIQKPLNAKFKGTDNESETVEDHKAIIFSMIEGITSTPDDRGYGSTDLQTPLLNSQKHLMTIFSNRGAVKFTNFKDAEATNPASRVAKLFQSSSVGTIVKWVVDIKEYVNEKH